MTNEDLHRYLQSPSLLNKDTVPELEKLVAMYPYAHTFVFLYLYNLALMSDIRYTSELYRLAPFLADRQKLFALVEKRFLATMLGDEKKEDDSFETIDRFLDQMTESPSNTPLQENVAHGDYFAMYKVSEEETDKEEDLLSIADSEESKSESKGELNREQMLTETLAQLYIEQGCYDKALNIIMAIRDKNPEKSSYFVDQIRFLKRLVDVDNNRK